MCADLGCGVGQSSQQVGSTQNALRSNTEYYNAGCYLKTQKDLDLLVSRKGVTPVCVYAAILAVTVWHHTKQAPLMSVLDNEAHKVEILRKNYIL